MKLFQFRSVEQGEIIHPTDVICSMGTWHCGIYFAICLPLMVMLQDHFNYTCARKTTGLFNPVFRIGYGTKVTHGKKWFIDIVYYPRTIFYEESW
jgi:hypothetical protein